VERQCWSFVSLVQLLTAAKPDWEGGATPTSFGSLLATSVRADRAERVQTCCSAVSVTDDMHLAQSSFNFPSRDLRWIFHVLFANFTG
jgi:hypothetical protein